MSRTHKSDEPCSRHVFSDLMAYSCTFEHCDHGPFGSRTAWASHEQRHHLRSWRCPVCHSDFDTETRVGRHMAAEHPTIDQTLSSELIYRESPRTERVPISQCPFCDDRRLWRSVLSSIALGDQSQDEQNLHNTLVPVSLYLRHMSRHMEQLALVAVPSSTGDSDDEGEASDRGVRIASSLGDTIYSFEETHESVNEHDVATDTTGQPTPADPFALLGIDAEETPQYPDSGMPDESDHLLNFRPDRFGPKGAYATQEQHLQQHSATDADEPGEDIGADGQGEMTLLRPTINSKGDDDRGPSGLPLDSSAPWTGDIEKEYDDRPPTSPAPDRSSSFPPETDSIPFPPALPPELDPKANDGATIVPNLPPLPGAWDKRYDEEYLARESAREASRRQRTLDEAIIRRQQDLEAAENRQLDREAERARYRRSFDPLHRLPIHVDIPDDTLESDHTSWSRHTDPPAPPKRPYATQTKTRFASSDPTHRHRNHAQLTVHEYHYPDSSPPSDSIRERGRKVIESERARVAAEDHQFAVADGMKSDQNSEEPTSDKVGERASEREYYVVSEGSARQEVRRRRDRDDSRRRERRDEFFR